MAEILGYISSYFVLFGLGVGFLFGGIIFGFFIVYAGLLLFKRTRRAVREDQARALNPFPKRTLSSRHSRKNSNFVGKNKPAKI